MELGHPVVMLSSWGSTETAPACTDCHFQAVRSGVIGVPIPGTTLKLVPVADKLEVRVKGPNLFPGYWKQPELTAKAFDEEGYYMIGDAVSFVDPARPEQGLLFDGRVAEDFKLLSGTWVHVGSIRVAGISALSPIAQDIVRHRPRPRRHRLPDVSQHPECRRLAGLGDDVPSAQVVAHPAIKERVARRHGAPQAAGRRFIHLSGTRPADGRAALIRTWRTHRQGLHQPARGADPPRRPGRRRRRRTPTFPIPASFSSEGTGNDRQQLVKPTASTGWSTPSP
jgi:hypothetical protein